MNYGGDAADQIVRYSMEGMEHTLRISGSIAKNLAVLIVAAVVLPAFGAAFGVPVIDPLRWYLSGVLSWFMEILGG
mgnify:CR=1 FL=1